MGEKQTLTAALIFFVIGTALYITVLVQQYKIILHAREQDPLLKSKLFFFLFTVFNVITTLVLVVGVIWSDKSLLLPSAAFYTVSAIIATYAYYSKKNITP